MSDWGEDEAPATKSTGGGFGQSNGGSNGDSGGGFGKASRGFGGRGRGFGNKDDGGDNNESSGWGDDSSGSKPGFPSRGSGFSGRGGFKGRNRDDDNGDSGGGFGGRRGGGGFGRSRRDDNGDDGDGGERKGGFGGGGFKGRRDNDDGGGGGFRGRRDNDDGGGGFKGRRRDNDNGDEAGGDGGDGEGEKKRELYIPPAPPETEEEMFDKMAIGINFEKYQEIPVEVTGRDPPQSVSTFEQCDFFETTRSNIAKCGYAHPTPVQKYAIPIISGGRDLMACAQTGSGKTAAFLLPVITRLIRDNVPGASNADTQSPDVLVISPTRELTLQIYNEARKFVHTSIYRPVVIYGGTSVGHQLRQLENGCNILVATPGRLMDFLNRQKVLLNNLKVLILDEADRMLDMGFEPEIRKVVEQFGMPDKSARQTLMFSATFPEEIQRLAADFLHDHLFLTVGVVGGTTSDILQSVIVVDDSQKKEKLQELLLEGGTDRVLVFVETKRTADFLAGLLCQESFPTTSIHGDRFQREREEALRDFRSGRCPVLVATSVAARGLDIPKVKHVINYDLPSSIEEYVHRIGRTGRIGNKGKATAFFQTDKDGNLARSLVKVLSDANQDVPEFLESAAAEAVGTNYGSAGGKFASKDIRQFGGGRKFGGHGGDSSGYGNDTGGFGTGFDETTSGGTFDSAPPPAADDDEW